MTTSMNTMPFTDSSEIIRHLYTSIIIVNDKLQIDWINAQAQQLFSTSTKRILGYSILQVLLPISEDINVGKGQYKPLDQSVEDSDAKNSGEDNSNERDSDEKLKPSYIKGLLNECQQENLYKLTQQFLHAMHYQQPFLDYNQHISGIVRPILVDYSVTPIEHNLKPYYIVEIWPKDRQSRIDQEQRQNEQHDVARHILRSVAHEVKNPLAGIRGGAQLLSRHITAKTDSKATTKYGEKFGFCSESQNLDTPTLVKVDSTKVKTYADIIISETDRLTNLISQLLGSNQPSDWQAVNIHEPLEHVLMLTQTQHPSVNIVRDYDLSLPELIADKDQLIQVFLNLVNNACDAMLESTDVNNNLPSGSHTNFTPTLTISTRIEFQFTIGTNQHRQVAKICIKDNGVGIDPALLGRIFYPLVTGRASGTGLGLSLVQDMVNRHHGAIQVKSIPGDTSFSIYLPFEQPDKDDSK